MPSYPPYLEAAKAARRIAGVTSVHNHLEVQLPAECYRHDAMLTAVANNTLAANSTIPDGVQVAGTGCRCSPAAGWSRRAGTARPATRPRPAPVAGVEEAGKARKGGYCMWQ